MVSTMTTPNVGRRTAATRGRGTSKQNGQEGERSGDQAGSGRGSQEGGRGGLGSGRELPTIGFFPVAHSLIHLEIAKSLSPELV
ncbi:hypothetical protein Tco_1087780 [Tanacetum coccineum]